MLLRGLGRDQRHWGEFISRFQQVFSADRVTVLDTCGNGIFARLKSPLSIAKYTDHCRAQLADPSPKVHLVALSLGGMVALDWAQRYGHEVLSVTLINSSAANLTPWNHRIYFDSLAKLALSFIASRNPEIIEKTILQITSNSTSNDGLERQALVTRWAEFRQRQHTSTVNLIRQLIAASRFKVTRLDNLKPLVLSSKTDRLVNSVASVNLNRYFGGEIVVHETAGHDLPLDDGVWVIEQIRRCHINVTKMSN